MRWKGVLAAIVIGGAAVSILAYSVNSRMALREGVKQSCVAEFKTLPAFIETASVVDQTAGLGYPELIQLLSERSLDFVEVKIAEEPVKAKAVLYAQSGWVKADWAKKPYLRLTLGKASAASCRPELKPSSGWPAPLKPDTCLLAVEVDTPSAQVRIEQLAAKRTWPRSLGWRQVVDVNSGRVLARLTSDEEQGIAWRGSAARLRRLNDVPKTIDCHAPHLQLADLLYGPRNAKPTTRAGGGIESGIATEPFRSFESMSGSGSEL
ncbi:hypothetical protein ACG02S_25585 [Roseateles sp. DC23W]|uniref:Cell division protein FtsQ n=1 Tax=Pelomonas dachongensis TaxID=3299029 RepID=A0ABW7EUT6_9BURK